MKLSWGFILSSLYASASAVTFIKSAHVFTWDPTSTATSNQPVSVSPETARLIFAKRLGLSRFHSIKDADKGAIQQLNQFGGRQQKLFGGDRDSNEAHALIWLENVENMDEIIKDSKGYSEFTISSPPPPESNERLVLDMILQAESLPKKADPLQRTHESGRRVRDLLSSVLPVDTYNDYLTIARADMKVGKISPTALASKIFYFMEGAPSQGISVTVVLMPPASPKTKRSSSPYGTYDLPSNVEARREKSEALLSPSSSQPSGVVNNASANEMESSAHITADEPVLGILPSCFESEKVAFRKTNNCSAHGSLQSRKRSSNELKDCFYCKCEPTIVGSGNAKKTTNWGGPACQKKDISVPFWLFVASTLLIVFLISTGIGMLYSIGNEELPSVIGAGVSGPTRK